MTREVTIDLDTVDPAHLEELAALIRQEQWDRAARLAEIADRPALGYYRRWREAT
jgi:hypothetical protein